MDSTTWDQISQVIGWTYFAAWSVSFYPQILLILRRKSSDGLSLDFAVYNVIGFLCYMIYQIGFYSNETIRKQYADQNNGQMPLVRVNDLVFAIHAFILTSITLILAVYYNDNSRRLSVLSKLVISSLLLIFASLLVICLCNVIQVLSLVGFTHYIYDFQFYFLSLVKLLSSLCKYIPQVYLNFTRKSTKGWSILNVLLDLTGGILSILQLVLDAWIQNNWSGITGNFIKIGLGSTSLVFDVIFIMQHYFLYNNQSKYQLFTQSQEFNSEEQEQLLP